MAFHPFASRKGARRLAAVGAAAALTAALLPGQAAVAAPGAACDSRANNTYQKLLDCVTAEGVTEHLEAFQKIAENNPDPEYGTTRAAGTPGYQASVDYVAGLLEDAGYTVTLDPVEITYAFPAELRQLTPVAADYETGVYSGSGEGVVTGNVVPVDINLTPPRAQHERVRRSLHRGGGRVADRGGPRRSERLRRLPRREHRAHPAGWLQLRAQGPERRGSRRIRRHHLQPGQHARPRGAVHRQRDPAGGERRHRDRHPRRRRQLRGRLRPRAAGFDGVRRGDHRDAHRLQRDRGAAGKNRTTS